MIEQEQYDREYSLQMGSLLIPTLVVEPLTGVNNAPLKIQFTVDRTKKKDPNNAVIDIYNLQPSSRNKLVEGEPLILEAGYVGTSGVIFTGEITYAYCRKEGTNWRATIECGDGETTYRSSRINTVLTDNTPILDVINAVVDTMDVGVGNLPERFFRSPPRDQISIFTQGLTLTGKSVDVLDQYLKTMGYEWSIQNGELSILAPDETTMETTLVIASSNIVNSPEINNKGIVRLTTLLQPGMDPGRSIMLNSAAVQGILKVESVRHIGDTRSNAWYSDMEGKLVA